MSLKIMGLYFAILIIILSAVLSVTIIYLIERNLEDRNDSYQQGSTDGRAAAIADYPRRNGDCPSGHSTAYCLGWDSGYATGYNERKSNG